MNYGFPRFYIHLKLTYFDDFDQNHHFWSLIALEPNIHKIKWNAFWEVLYFIFKINY